MEILHAIPRFHWKKGRIWRKVYGPPPPTGKVLLPGEWWRVLPRAFRDPCQPVSPYRAQSWSLTLERGSARCIGEAVSTASLTTPTGHQELRRSVCRQILTEMSEQGGPPLRWRMTRYCAKIAGKGGETGFRTDFVTWNG